MSELTASPTHAIPPNKPGTKRRKESASTPRIQLSFELPGSASQQARASDTTTNPFASPVEGTRGGGATPNHQEETTNEWSFQGRKKHTLKLTSPKPEAQSPIPHTPPQEKTPGGKRGQHHSEVTSSFFTSFSISIPQNWEPLRARVWPVLAREKNSQREIVVHSKSQARPSLPTNIRITGPVEAEWSHDSAWADLTHRLEVELEEKILRYKLSFKDRPKLEWSWQEVPNRRGVECTILAHIDTGTSALNIQNKRHLHWKALELIPTDEG
ncbi:unnamed protein product [Sphagnum jensenii]|uniref:Uncharacterized protein n=1 Tax=Sphagnum jensenii TaxID=128206 RepID=A0ABP1AY33_9BRYO